jgi:hypothetical protein
MQQEMLRACPTRTPRHVLPHRLNSPFFSRANQSLEKDKSSEEKHRVKPPKKLGKVSSLLQL